MRWTVRSASSIQVWACSKGMHLGVNHPRGALRGVSSEKQGLKAGTTCLSSLKCWPSSHPLPGKTEPGNCSPDHWPAPNVQSPCPNCFFPTPHSPPLLPLPFITPCKEIFLISTLGGNSFLHWTLVCPYSIRQTPSLYYNYRPGAPIHAQVGSGWPTLIRANWATPPIAQGSPPPVSSTHKSNFSQRGQFAYYYPFIIENIRFDSFLWFFL